MKRIFRLFHKLFLLFITTTICVATLKTDRLDVSSREAGLSVVLSNKTFNLIGWMFRAGASKIGHELIAPQNNMRGVDQVAWVREYLRRVLEFHKTENDIQRAYVDPGVEDPEKASRSLREKRDAIRSEISARQNIAESILQEQIESILREEGFAFGGQTMPPLRFRFTELPDVLIVSRRDRIEKIDQRELTTGLTVDAVDRIEREVDERFDVSSMVTPIGGYGTYPTMLPESSSLRFTLDTAIHEWVHNYLFFSDVGFNYNEDPVARTINETTATIVQRELTDRVLAKFYPDLLKADASTKTAALASDTFQEFNFNKAMRETRVRTDDLLAEGKVEEAERYMEERRALFVQNGYAIRKLNQAYFAFYGSYNAEPGGAPTAGRDPVGPAVQALRARSATLGDFLRAVAKVRSLEDVERSR